MLTEVKLKSLKPKEKVYKLADEKGLYIRVAPSGARYWRLKYYMGGKKERHLALGVYPEVTLKEARSRRDDARLLIRDGIDPGEERKRQRAERKFDEENSFGQIADEWFSRCRKKWGQSHRTRTERILKKDLAGIRSRPITSIDAPELLKQLRRIEARGALETTRRARQIVSQVYRYGIAAGLPIHDIARDLADALEAPTREHRAAITDWKKVGPLLRDLWAYQGAEPMRAALKLAPLTFVRPGELRRMEWSEIDFDDALWTIPKEKMKSVNTKNPRDHMIPLATQSVEILRQLQEVTGEYRWAFPSGRTVERPMSDNGVLSALRSLEIPKETMSGHGFRAMARTLLDEELEVPVDWIEMQLAHVLKDPNGQAYNRSKYLKQRRGMMQKWADYLDLLRDPKVSVLRSSSQ